MVRLLYLFIPIVLTENLVVLQTFFILPTFNLQRSRVKAKNGNLVQNKTK